jgi:hypothetical protein
MIEAVKGLSGVMGVRQEEDRLVMDVIDPSTVNPDIVRELVRQGGRVKFVSEVRRSLEDVYLRILGEDNEAR